MGALIDTILEKILGSHTFAQMSRSLEGDVHVELGAAAPWDRWDSVALALAVFTTVWVFALKLKTFYDLGYSEDLFVSLQAARSWLEGKGILRDNCWGNVLAVHTYFLLLPLGLIAKPFGAPGLLFVLSASVGATYFWATRILRLLGVAGPLAIVRPQWFLSHQFRLPSTRSWPWIPRRGLSCRRCV